MAYIDIYNAATAADSSLRKQIVVAMQKASVDIQNEDGLADGYAARKRWSDRINNTGLDAMAEIVIWKVLENAAIQANPSAATDSDVQFVVNSLVQFFGGDR